MLIQQQIKPDEIRSDKDFKLSNEATAFQINSSAYHFSFCISTYMKIFRISFFLLILAELFVITSCTKEQGDVVHVPVEIRSVADIHPINDSLVIPYFYQGFISLDTLSVADRKQKFIALLLPTILVSKYKLNQNYTRFLTIIERDISKWSMAERFYIDSLQREYKTADTAKLRSRLMSHPNSIVLAQAALESAWGTSRFFIEAGNPFGIWSFNENESRIISKSTRDGKSIYLRKYNDLQESMDDYFKVIACGPYSQFRDARKRTNSLGVLIPQLVNYSENKNAYTQDLINIIQKNNLDVFDHYAIHPDYIR
jgi:Bax protein